MKKIVLLSLLVLLPSLCFADAEKDFSYIKKLYSEKDYFRCISEAKRFLFYNSESNNIPDVELLIADSYYDGGDQKEAFLFYSMVAEKYKNTNFSHISFYRIGIIQYDNDLFCDSLKTFKKLIEAKGVATDLTEKARHYIDMISLENGGDSCGLEITREHTSDNFDAKKLEYLSLNRKSPEVAGALSAVVPGLGQFYVDRPRDAFVAFLLNGLFIWGIVEAAESDNWGAATALGAIELGWYSGNIYSAVSGAHKYNEKQKNHLFNKYKIDYQLNLVGNDDKKIYFAFNYSF